MNALVKVGLGIGAAVVGCYFLRKSGADKKIVGAVKKVGAVTGQVAGDAIDLTIQTGASAADLGIAGAKATVDFASAGVEAAGYGVGRSARFVLDATNKVGTQTSNNPLSRGIVSGFYAPEIKAQSPVEKTYDAVNGALASA